LPAIRDDFKGGKVVTTQKNHFATEFLRYYFKGGIWPLRTLFVIILAVLISLSFIFYLFEKSSSSENFQDMKLLKKNTDSSASAFRVKQDSPVPGVHVSVSESKDELKTEHRRLERFVPNDTLEIQSALASVNNNILRIFEEIESWKQQSLPGRNWRENLFNASLVTFAAATLGLGDYHPKTYAGKIILILAGCMGLITFGMLSGIGFAAARAAFRKTHPEMFEKEK
jgi:hypothetical protein